MKSLPPNQIRLPRVLLEHPLPLSAPGFVFSTSYQDASAKSFQLTLGADRFQRAQPSTPAALTLETFSLLATLLSLTERQNHTLITYNQLFRAYTLSSSCCSAHHRETLKRALSDLSLLFLSKEQPGQAASFEPLLTLTSAVTRPVFGRLPPAFLVDFAPSLLSCIDDPRASAPFLLNSFLSLRSRYARALYPILTSWCAYSANTHAQPFRIGLSKLMTHLGIIPPRYLSQRRAFFNGHRAQSIFDELQNIPTPYGALRLSLEPARTLQDDCLIVQLQGLQKRSTDAPGQESRESPGASTARQLHRSLKIFKAWEDSGRREPDFLTRVRDTSVSLSAEDREILTAASISPSKCENFLLMAKKLLPKHTWIDLLGEAKYAALSTTPPRNPAGKLINETLSAIRSGI